MSELIAKKKENPMNFDDPHQFSLVQFKSELYMLDKVITVILSFEFGK